MLLKNQERLVAVLLGLVAIGYLYTGLGYRLGSVSRPGPGFFPLVLSVVAGLLIVKSFLTAEGQARTGANRGSIVFVLMLVVFGVLLMPLGFIPSGILFVAVTMRLMGDRNIPASLLFGAICALLIHFVFETGFSIPLPKGVLAWIL